MFVDEATIVVRSGDGGRGSVSFRREKYVPRGGPDGGDGGRGGDVVFFVKENVKTLASLRLTRHYRAQNGRPGSGRLRTGADGLPVEIVVPPGTVVVDPSTREKLLDLTKPGERTVLLRGGRGGKGNNHFKSSRHQTPRFAQPGEEGEEREIVVELRIIADVGFVGLPNAGKSTLLKVLTSANPKIGDYPFTTVIPNLGVMRFRDRDVVLADVPGLIKGASGGAGLGTRFLKHLSRTVGLAYVLDLGEDPERDLETLREEVRAYGGGLLEKRSIILVNKLDLDPDHEISDTFSSAHDRVVSVSAATGENVAAVRDQLFQLVKEATEPDSNDGVILFGGSFDPVHEGHLRAARAALEIGGWNKIVFVPTSSNPLKTGRPVADDRHRIAMLKIATRGMHGCEISSVEIDRQGTSFTYDTVCRFRDSGMERIALLVGDDLLGQLPNWHRAEELFQLVHFIVVARDGVNASGFADLVGRDRCTFLKNAMFRASSTEVRDEIGVADENRAIPADVAAYIHENHLYE